MQEKDYDDVRVELSQKSAEIVQVKARERTARQPRRKARKPANRELSRGPTRLPPPHELSQAMVSDLQGMAKEAATRADEGGGPSCRGQQPAFSEMTSASCEASALARTVARRFGSGRGQARKLRASSRRRASKLKVVAGGGRPDPSSSSRGKCHRDSEICGASRGAKRAKVSWR